MSRAACRRARPLLALAVVATLALVLAACGGSGGTSSSEEDPTLRFGMTIGLSSFDPNGEAASTAGTGDTPYLRLVYDTLVDGSATDGTLAPSLATSWEQEGVTLTFHLREDVTFTDGSRLDAEVAKANLDANRESRLAQGASTTGSTAPPTAEVVDDYTVRLTFDVATSEMASQYTGKNGMMISAAALGTESLDQEPVGSGPYTYAADRSTTGARYVYERNPDYWNPDAQHFGTVELLQFEDPSAQQNALRSGQVDVATLDPSFASQAEEAGYDTVTVSKEAWLMLIQDRDGTLSPALGDERVRQAIAYAIDRVTFVDVIVEGYGEPTTQLYAEGSRWYDESLAGDYEYDPDKARELLADAGYEDGFSFSAPSSSATSTAVTAIQGMLDEVGITMEVKLVDQASFNPTTGEYPVFIASFPIDEPATGLAVFLGDSPLNAFDVADPELTALADEAATTVDADARKALNDQLLEEVIDQGIVVSLSTSESVAAHSGAVADVTWNLDDPVPNILTITPAG